MLAKTMFCSGVPLVLFSMAAPFTVQAGFISTFQELSPTPTVFTLGVDQEPFVAANGNPMASDLVTGSATGLLLLIPNLGCNTSDFSSFVAGDIALIKRGGVGCLFSAKGLNAQTAGAIGYVVYDNGVEPLPSPSLGVPGPTIPGVFITNADGLGLAGAIANGPVNVSLSVSSVPEPSTLALAAFAISALVGRLVKRRLPVQ